MPVPGRASCPSGLASSARGPRRRTQEHGYRRSRRRSSSASESLDRRASIESASRAQSDPVHTHRRRNVLDRLLAEVVVGEVELAPRPVSCTSPERQMPPGLGERLEPSRHVHARRRRASRSLVGDHLAQVDTDAEVHALRVRAGRRSRARAATTRWMATAHVTASERGRETPTSTIVARARRRPGRGARSTSPAMSSSRSRDRPDRRGLVRGHEPAVAHGVGGEDRGEAASTWLETTAPTVPRRFARGPSYPSRSLEKARGSGSPAPSGSRRGSSDRWRRRAPPDRATARRLLFQRCARGTVSVDGVGGPPKAPLPSTRCW